MKLRLLLPFGALALAAVSSAQFAPQTLAVVTLGDGTTTLSANGVATQLQNFTKSGGAGSATVTLPIFNSGTASSEGALILDGSGSGDLYAIGYAAGGAGVTSSAGSANARTVARYNYLTGASSAITLGANDFSGSNPRSAVGINGTIYAGGAASGTGAEGGALVGSSTGTVDLTKTGVSSNIRVLQNLGGSLFYSTGSTGGGASVGINQINADGTNTVIAASTTITSPYDFVFADNNTLFVADDRTTGAGGIYRFTRGANGAFGTPTQIFATGVRQLAFDGTTLFATTAEVSNNNLLSVSLDGTSSNVLASAGANKVFRGVEVVPEPASMAAMALGLGALASRRRKKKSA